MVNDCEKLDELLKQKIFKLKDATILGIHHFYVQNYVNMGKLEKVSHGIYAIPDVLEDKMYILGLKRKAIIYSHETALFLHELTDRDPISYDVTVPTGYNTKNLLEDGLTVYSVKRSIHTLGLTKSTTIYGNEVRCYDVERTICDILRSRNKIDICIISDTMKRYCKSKYKNLNKLMEYAKTFKITRILKNYTEVLI